MKILHINQNYKCLGGTENYIKNLKRNFLKQNHEIFIFCVDDEINKKNKKTFVYKNNFKKGFINPGHALKKYILWFYFNPNLYFSLKNWIKEVEPDVIHLHNIGKFTTTILLALKSLDIPIVQTIHDPSVVCPSSLCFVDNEICDGGFGIKCVRKGCIPIYRYLYEKFPNLLKNLLLKYTIKIFISPSKALKDCLINNGFNNVQYLPNFIDGENFQCDNQKIKDTHILYVGRISHEKGVEYLIKSIPKVIEKYPSCIFDVVGDGPLKKDLLEITKKLNLADSVVFHGNLDNELVQKMYEKSKIVVVPSVWLENSPIVIYESMACGKTIIASNIGGIPDLIKEGETGFLIEPQNSNEIANKIIEILSNPDIANKIGSNAKKECKTKYNPKSHSKFLNDIYNSLI